MKNSKLNDADIIEGFRNNRKDIIVLVYKLILPNVSAFVMSRGGSKKTAVEVAWRAITKFWQRCQKPDFELKDHKTGFAAYITRTYRNIWLEWHTEGKVKHKKESLEQPEMPETTVHQDNESTEQTRSNTNLERYADDSMPDEKIALNNVSRLIWQMVDKLSVKCRDFFNLYYRQELSYEEIAELKNVSAGAIRKQKNECKEPFMQELLKSNHLTELEENYPGLINRILK